MKKNKKPNEDNIGYFGRSINMSYYLPFLIDKKLARQIDKAINKSIREQKKKSYKKRHERVKNSMTVTEIRDGKTIKELFRNYKQDNSDV